MTIPNNPFKRPSQVDGDPGPDAPLPPDESASWAPSEAATKWEWERAFRDRFWQEVGSRSAFVIAATLAMYANGDGTEARPSVERLMGECGYGRSSVMAALKELRNSGWVQQVEKGSGAARRASEYRLSIPARVQPTEPHQTR